jgi:hypothetical protein
MGIDQTQQYMSRIKQYVDELSKVGGMDFGTLQTRAHELAQQDMMNANLGYRDLEGMTGRMKTGESQPGIIPPEGNVPGVPGGAPKTQPKVQVDFEKPPTPEQIELMRADLARTGDQNALAAFNTQYPQKMSGAPVTQQKPTYVPTPAEVEGDKQTHKNYADQHQADLASIAGIRNMGPSLNAMKAILSNPNLINVGPLHEQLTELGGFMAYIDPSSDLAKSVNNTPAYFSNLMNLVRDKIAALGSGTAVSNLDLIVSQMSAGSLENTLNGRVKIIGAARAMNEAMAIIQEKKRVTTIYF